ncbi:N-acyl-D-amino-acid deacylase family protein [Flavisphingomonas formosensis]|uniref:N-acyl-D-amino-acid deacylase family protein n=1 Tax=Flavisphingomonas formosensis TaxID=861534 RepID=UPI0012F77856|nr:amidohydrolase family protein [Sphingomonas formosensis]
MLDVVIRGGTLVDGTGAPPRSGDLAIEDGRIVAIGGRITGKARRVIDADGALVTPGFVDVHSHYDGQATWDDTLDPSFSNGITTTVFGNCGVGFAPVRTTDQDRMVAVMEGVEAIPGIVLKEGVPFSWESFPEYMDFLDGRRFGVDVGVMIAHAPLRVYAMGERAVAHERATEAEVSLMADAVRGAMAAGAMGMSSGRVEEHFYGETFEKVPGTYAEHEELETLARAMGESGRGHFQVVARGTAGAGMQGFIGRDARIAEHRLFEMIARVSGRPVHYLLPQIDADPEDWRAMLAETAKANAAGLSIHAHIATRGMGMLTTLDGYHNFMLRPAYLEIAHLPRKERAAAMRDPARRAAILAQEDLPPGNGIDMITWGTARVMTERAPIAHLFHEDTDYEPDETIGAIAARTGKDPQEIVYDHLAAGDGDGVVPQMLLNYSNGNLDHVHEMLTHPNTLSSLGDGGAHVRLIADASLLPMHLSFWARDRKRGPKFSLESMVERITRRNARAFGMHDRGELTLGKRADVNVIDFDRLNVRLPTMRHDLPAGGARLCQETTGFVATLQNGVVTRERDADMGERPGRLIRAKV